MTEEFNSIEEIEKYYNKETNAYIFKENGRYIDVVVLNFNLDVKADIYACNIMAHDISAYDITACDISAWDIFSCDIYAYDINAHDINAHDINAGNIDAYDINAYNIFALDINYYSICFAYDSIRCKSINSIMTNAQHFVLNGVLEVEE